MRRSQGRTPRPPHRRWPGRWPPRFPARSRPRSRQPPAQPRLPRAGTRRDRAATWSTASRRSRNSASSGSRVMPAPVPRAAAQSCPRSRCVPRVLAQHRLDPRRQRDRLVHRGIAAGAIGAEPHQIRHLGMQRQDRARAARQRILARRVAAGHRARQRAQHVHRRIAAALGDPPVEHDVPVEDAAHRVRHRLVVVVAFHQHGEQRGDVARRGRRTARARARRVPAGAAVRRTRSADSRASPAARPRTGRSRAAPGRSG